MENPLYEIYHEISNIVLECLYAVNCLYGNDLLAIFLSVK